MAQYSGRKVRQRPGTFCRPNSHENRSATGSAMTTRGLVISARGLDKCCGLDSSRTSQVADHSTHELVKLQMIPITENGITIRWLFFFIITSITNFTRMRHRKKTHSKGLFKNYLQKQQLTTTVGGGIHVHGLTS